MIRYYNDGSWSRGHRSDIDISGDRPAGRSLEPAVTAGATVDAGRLSGRRARSFSTATRGLALPTVTRAWAGRGPWPRGAIARSACARRPVVPGWTRPRARSSVAARAHAPWSPVTPRGRRGLPCRRHVPGRRHGAITALPSRDGPGRDTDGSSHAARPDPPRCAAAGSDCERRLINRYASRSSSPASRARVRT